MGLTVAKQKRSGSGFFWGLMIGIAVGATIAWVLTPQPGEIEERKAPEATGANGANGANGATPDAAKSAATRATNATTPPTIVDLAQAAIERVRGRLNEAIALGREAYTQSQSEVMQRFNQARTVE